MADCATEGTLGDQEQFALHRIADARAAGAKLLNCLPDEVSLVGPTSLGLSLVAAGLEFRRGDNVLIYHDDYPSNVYPWMALAAKGVKVRLLNTRGLGVAGAAGKAGQPQQALGAGGRVLAQMLVGAGHDEPVEAPASEFGAQIGESGGVHPIHSPKTLTISSYLSVQACLERMAAHLT